MLRILPPRFKPVLVATSCVTLTSDWIKLRGSHSIHGIYVTCCKTNLPWAGKMRLSTFCNNFSQPATTWFVAREVWFMGGKTRNISFEPVLQQCCKTSCTYLLSVLQYLYPKNVYYRILSYDRYGPPRNFVGNPYASSEGRKNAYGSARKAYRLIRVCSVRKTQRSYDKMLIDRVRSGQTCARSVRPDLEPNIFPYGPTTQSVST